MGFRITNIHGPAIERFDQEQRDKFVRDLRDGWQAFGRPDRIGEGVFDWRDGVPYFTPEGATEARNLAGEWWMWGAVENGIIRLQDKIAEDLAREVLAEMDGLDGSLCRARRT